MSFNFFVPKIVKMVKLSIQGQCIILKATEVKYDRNNGYFLMFLNKSLKNNACLLKTKIVVHSVISHHQAVFDVKVQPS